MTSTYVSYRALAQDITTSLARLATRTDVARDADYYQKNIGQIKSVDDFLADQRLYTFAMRSYGLTDMIYAKAFMRKVLVSDLGDDNSFAKKLVDPRFVTFARAFNFGTDGAVAPTLTYVQSDVQEDETIGLYSQYRVTLGTKIETEGAYYRARIGSVQSVDTLLNDERLFSYALTAFGIDPKTASKAVVRDVLTSDLSDTESVVNRLGDNRFVALAGSFDFESDGSVAGGSTAQSDPLVELTVYLNYERTGTGASPAAGANNTRYYQNGIAQVATVDDFLNDDRLLRYALTAFGINPNVTAQSTVRNVLLSDLDDPDSFANQLGDRRLRAFAEAFNFNADGTLNAGDSAQTAANLNLTTAGYLEKFDDAAEASESFATQTYRNVIKNFAHVDDLLHNKGAYTYALTAFGLDPNTESRSKIRQILISDVSDPSSFVNRQTDKRYRALAAAFNFGPGGDALQPRKAQLDDDELATIGRYNATVGAGEADIAQAKLESAYYHTKIIGIGSVDTFLKDERLLDYVLRAFGLNDAGLSADTLRRVLTSDPMDPASFANRSKDARLRDLAAAYNFTEDGKLGRVPELAVQTRSDILVATDGFYRQTMESEAGAQNEGVRLALYFQRKVPNIRNAYDILADKALAEVVRTALGIPASSSQMPIDSQAAMLEKRLNMADMKDPVKLEKFMARFCVMYDLDNGITAVPSAASIILGNVTSSLGSNASLLASLQRYALSRSQAL